MYNFDSNYINAVPVKSRKTDEYIKAFQLCYNLLCRRGFIVQLLQLNNEVSKALIDCIETNELDF